MPQFRIGLIADTHSLLRPQALAFLHGCDHIIHGGDIDKPGILEVLAGLAPLTAVRGNTDKGAWAASLPQTAQLTLGGISIYVLHDLAQLELGPAAAAVRVVVSAHTHQPRVHERGDVLFVNPGSAGPRRFSLPVSVGELAIRDGAVSARIVELALEDDD